MEDNDSAGQVIEYIKYVIEQLKTKTGTQAEILGLEESIKKVQAGESFFIARNEAEEILEKYVN